MKTNNPVDDARKELILVLKVHGLHNHLKVNRHAIRFLYEVHGSSFNKTIKLLKKAISSMEGDDDHKTCPTCTQWLVITGAECWHTSTSLFYFCLNCGGRFEWYRDKNTNTIKRIFRLKTDRIRE